MDPDITENITSRKLRNPRLEIGGAVFPEECMREAEIRFEGDEHVRSRSAYVVLTPPAELRWDFKEDAKLYEDGEVILTGPCADGFIHDDDFRTPLQRITCPTCVGRIAQSRTKRRRDAFGKHEGTVGNRRTQPACRPSLHPLRGSRGGPR